MNEREREMARERETRAADGLAGTAYEPGLRGGPVGLPAPGRAGVAPGLALRGGLFVIFLGGSVLAGCNGAEELNPVPVPSATVTDTGTGGAGGEGGAPPASTPVRTVEKRNPFGNVAVTDNLLWDGDFEWSSAFADQYGWLYGPPYSYSFPAATIGAVCRSGVKCVTVPDDKAVIGIGVGAQSSPLSVSVSVRPETGDCTGVDVFLIDSISLAKDVGIPSVSEAPDAAGWCLYQGTVESYPEQVYLLVDNDTGGPMVVDDAVVRALPPGEPSPPAAPPRMEPPTADRASHREAARAAVRRLRVPHDPPPNAARRAFEARSQCEVERRVP